MLKTSRLSNVVSFLLLLLLSCEALAADAKTSAPAMPQRVPWNAIGAAAAILVLVGVVAFKNPRRSHLD